MDQTVPIFSYNCPTYVQPISGLFLVAGDDPILFLHSNVKLVIVFYTGVAEIVVKAARHLGKSSFGDFRKRPSYTV